jgi:hypothetical protein
MQADKTKSRGYMFVEYESHKAAALARRKLSQGTAQKPNSRMYNIVEVSGHNLGDFSDLRFPYTMFTLQTSFKPLLLQGWGE